MMPILLGAIADDLTGATDLCNALVRRGMRTVQLIGMPATSAVPDAEAVVMALKGKASCIASCARNAPRPAPSFTCTRRIPSRCPVSPKSAQVAELGS
jgi:uncharacterized protein YgbK (DUF1537 family)